MKVLPQIITLVVYMVFMFLAAKYFINPKATNMNNVVFAVSSGIIFAVLYALFKKMITRNKS